MTQYNTLKLKLSNSQLTNLKSAMKTWTKVTLNLSSNVVAHSWANKKLSKTQLPKIADY